jgi:hypothetical protein
MAARVVPPAEVEEWPAIQPPRRYQTVHPYEAEGVCRKCWERLVAEEMRWSDQDAAVELVRQRVGWPSHYEPV